nr:uncharacterized protein LOC127486985 [Oryctolagus cuniculus]
MFLCCIPRCRSPGPKKPCCGRLAQWWGHWANPHSRRTWRLKQKKARVQDQSASPLEQHSRLGIASSPDLHQLPKTDELCVVGQRSNMLTALKLPSQMFPSMHKPPEVPLSHLVTIAQREPRGSINAHLTAGTVGPEDGSTCAGSEARQGPGPAPDLTAGAEQTTDLQATFLLEQCWPSKEEHWHKDARGTAVSPGTEQGAPDTALAPASAPAPAVPSASAPVPHLSFPIPVILYFSLLLPIVFLFSTLLSLYYNKI